jgi:phospholipid/cholesterol/gamma-HCH transport system ATP-binding protein
MIEIKHLKKAFDGAPVLKDIQLTISEGETLVIVGGSGCGKTVLLRLIIGLVRPDEGRILVEGDDITRMNRSGLFAMRKNFGMLFQGAALFDSMTVQENIALPLKEHTALSKPEIHNKVREKLEMVGLHDIEDKKPSELSGGMKKRVGLARALIMEPRYVLFDEPTTGLDPIMSDAINNLILRTNARLNITSIVVTHDMNSAFKIGDRIAMIYNGRVIFSGTTREFNQSENPRVRQFIEGRAENKLS